MNNVLNEASTSHRSWNNLSMQEKAAMIRVAVKNGLTDLKTIREKYNEFAGGGSKRRQESINNAATQQAMKYFMGKGLTDYQAAGLVGNLFRESRLIPTATNAGSGAYGIAQWLGDRKKNLFAKYGKNPTLNQQLDYVWHELGNTHRTGLKAIKSSKNAEEAARNAMGYYEFSAGPEAAIREMRRWNQDGEGAMQKGINFASQLIGGPVVPFRAETPQWNNIPFTPANPEVFFSNPVTTSQPVVDMEPTKTPMLEYDPKEAERQEKRDNLSRFNMFLGMLNGSNESTFPFSMFAEGGKIHISPSKKGTFTAAASRHNMGVQEFASKVLANKDDYSPAMVKKANFARNASRWKHGLGGNLFEDGGPKKPLTRDDLRRMLLNRRAEAEAAYNGSVTETQITPNDNAWVDKPLTRRKKNPHSSRRAEEGAKAHAAWEMEHPNLAAWGNLAGTIPFAVASIPLGAGIVAGGDALAATTAGQAITSGLAPLYQAVTDATIAGAPALAWADAGLTSAFGAHGISQAVEDGGISPMTALEIAPLGRLAKPMYEGIVLPEMRLFNSPLTGNWTKISNREYRLNPNSLGTNGSPLEARSITPQITAENAASITPKVTHFYHGSPVRFDAFSADFIGSGEGGSKVMRGINLWPEEKIANAPKFANIKSPDAPLHLGVSNTPLGGELNPTVYDVSGRGLKLYTTTPRGVKGLSQSDLISQGYDGIQTPNQVTVFPESIGKLSIDKQSTIDEFILSHPEVERWTPWTTDTQKMNIIDMSKMSKWTPEQWTAAQDAAIARGDMAEAQRLRDLHFKVNAPNAQIVDKNGNPIHSYHGTGKHFNEFDTTGKYSTLDEGYYGVGAYFAPNKELAQMYADTERTPVVYDTYLNIKNPLRHVRDENADLYGKTIVDNDGVISKLPDDLVDKSFDMTEFVATKPNQIKLADAVTYGDDGVRIPLGERDNFNINDIRYGLLPFGIGLTGYGLWNKNE